MSRKKHFLSKIQLELSLLLCNSQSKKFNSKKQGVLLYFSLNELIKTIFN